MTVSYKKSGKNGGAYYIDSMSPAEKKKGVDDYYTAGEKEPPGVWYVGPDADGHRHTTVGIKDGDSFVNDESRSSTKDFSNLINGFNPKTGAKLAKNAGEEDRVALHDFTLSAPKSVSVLWSQADLATKTQIERLQEDSSRTFLDFMSKKSIIRDETAGIKKMQVPMRGALFGHGSSRENDPQLHTHCVMFNFGEFPDGTKTRALETMPMMKWQGAAASLYHSHLAFGMAQLNFRIQRKDNLFEIDGVSKAVNEAFSQRRAQIIAASTARMNELGIDPKSAAGRRLLRKAAIDTRSEKSDLTRSELETLWHERGKELGFTREEVNALMDSPPPPVLSSHELLEEARIAVQKITKMKSVFTEPDLITNVAVHLMGRASPQQILEAVESVKKELLSTELDRKTDISKTIQQQETAVIYTTQEMLVLEREMLECVDRQDGLHVLDDQDLPDRLTDEQREAAIAAISDTNAVTVIEGTAGAGKTFTMESISRAYERAGYSVTGLSAQWSAALNLKKEANLDDGRAITGWIHGVRSGSIKIGRRSLIVLDEAGMVDARQMRAVLKLAKDAHAKVILVGDTKQQKSVGAGDALRCITAKIDSKRLDAIRRQHRDLEKAAVLEFFAGHAKEGLQHYKDTGRVHIGVGDEAIQQRMVDDWQASRSRKVGDSVTFHRDGKDHTGIIERVSDDHWHVRNEKNERFEVLNSHLMLSLDKNSAMELNQLAHQARKDAGELGESRMIHNMDCRDDDKLEFSVGDEVVIRKTDKFSEAYNRTRGVIESFDQDKINIRTREGKLITMDPKDPKWQHKPDQPGLALQHAYATTVYSSQGVSVGHVFVKDHIGLARDSAGVAMSRHREDCQVYVDKQVRHESRMRKQLADQWKPIREFSDEECLDQVETTWSKDREKNTTLDFTDWKRDGAAVAVDLEVETAKAEEANRIAKAAIARIMAESKTNQIPLEPLKFQKSEQYRIETPNVDRDVLRTGLRKLDDAGLDPDVVERAIKNGALRFDRNGEAVFCGRRPGDNSVVSTQGGENPRNGPLRGRYPPILQGDPDSDRVDVVGSGQDALKLWSTQARQGKPLSTVVVSSGRGDVMRMPHVLTLTEEAEVVEYHDQPEDVAVDKDFEAEKVKQQAATELAAEQELTRKSATRGLSP